MSSFEPAARMHRPPTVWKNSVTSTTITAVTRPTAGALPPSTSKNLGASSSDTFEAAQHRDIHGIQAAHRQNACEMGWILQCVCKNPVTTPATAPASAPASSPANGCAAAHSTVETAMPNVNEPSTVGSGRFRMRNVMYTPTASSAYSKTEQCRVQQEVHGLSLPFFCGGSAADHRYRAVFRQRDAECASAAALLQTYWKSLIASAGTSETSLPFRISYAISAERSPSCVLETDTQASAPDLTMTGSEP